MQIKVPSAFAGQADMPASMPLGNKKHLIGIIPNSLKGFRRILTRTVVSQRRYLRYSIISMYILSKSNIPEWVFPYPGRIITPSRYDDCRKTTSYHGQAIAYCWVLSSIMRKKDQRWQNRFCTRQESALDCSGMQDLRQGWRSHRACS